MRLWPNLTRLVECFLLATSLLLGEKISAQTTTSGALTGVVTDQTNALSSRKSVSVEKFKVPVHISQQCQSFIDKSAPLTSLGWPNLRQSVCFLMVRLAPANGAKVQLSSRPCLLIKT